MRVLPFGIATSIVGIAPFVAASRASMLGHVVLWVVMGCALAVAINELLGKPLVFLRWSFLHVALHGKKLMTEWQVGDGREEDVARRVLGCAAPGDLDAAIAEIDRYAYEEKFLINVGDEKGALLDDIVRRARPRCVLELGTYVGYSALRMARALPPGGHVFSVEWNAANAAIARRIVAHAGAADRVTIIHGSIDDGGKTLAALRALGVGKGGVDVVFLDHDKNRYVADLERILEAGWLHPGSVAVADNVRVPGAPAYRAFLAASEGVRWKTRAHETHVEYQSLIGDVMLESTLLR